MEDFDHDFNKTAPHPADADPELKELVDRIAEARKALKKEDEVVLYEKMIARAEFLYSPEATPPAIYYYAYGESLNGVGREADAAAIMWKALASYDNEQGNPFLLGALVDLQSEILIKLGRREESEKLKARPDYLEANAMQWGVE